AVFFDSLPDPVLLSFPTRRSSDLPSGSPGGDAPSSAAASVHRDSASSASTPYASSNTASTRCPGARPAMCNARAPSATAAAPARSEEHTSELQSRENLVCRLLLEK